MTGISVALALIAYNNLANRIRAFHGWAYLPMNLFVTAVTVWFAFAIGGVSFSTIGVNHGFLEGTLAGLALGLIPVLLALPLLYAPKAIRVLADPRMRQVGWAEALYLVTLRIPLGTALTEELLFRGVLLSLLESFGRGEAVVISSVAFGLWHIMPGINRRRAGTSDASRSELASAALLAVVSTIAGGVVLSWVRIASGGLGMPFGIHTALNSGGALLAVAAFRRLAKRDRGPGGSAL